MRSYKYYILYTEQVSEFTCGNKIVEIWGTSHTTLEIEYFTTKEMIRINLSAVFLKCK